MPKHWPLVSLGELLTLERRPVKIAPDADYVEIGIYCFGRGIFHKLPRTGPEVGDKDLYLIKEGDFILQVTFAWEGAVALASRAEDGMFGSVRFPTFRVDEARCFPPYLLNYFRTRAGLQQLVSICPGSAGRNRVLSIKRIPEVHVPLPAPDEQQRIAACIEQLAAKIQEARRLKSRAEGESELILNAAERSILGDPEHFRSPVKPLEEVCSVFIDCDHRTPDYKEEGITLLRPRDIKRGYIDFSATVRIDPADHERRCARHRPGLGDIVYSRELSFGNAGIISRQIDVSLGQGTLLVHANARLMLDHFLLRLLNAPAVRQQAESAAKGAAHPHVNLQDIRRFLVPVPSLLEQRRIVAHLDGLQAKADALKQLQTETATELDALLPSVLDMAFKGEL